MKEKDTKTQNKPKKQNKTGEQSKNGKKIFMKVLNILINVMIVMVLIISLLVAFMAISSKSKGVPSVFGYTVQSIQSPSMKGGSDEYEGGNFDEGDVIIGKISDSDREAPYEVGDIVSYYGFIEGKDEEVLFCHRIVEVNKDDTGYSYVTKGDNNPDPDSSVHYNSEIKSVYYTKDYHGFKIKGVGKFLDSIQTQKGFFVFILLPMIIFFLYELIRVVLNFSKYKNAKSDEEKEAAVKEAIAAAKSDNDGEAKLPEGFTEEQMEQFKQFIAAQNQQKEEQADTAEDTADAADEADAEDSSDEAAVDGAEAPAAADSEET